jgi:hypothetical protein
MFNEVRLLRAIGTSTKAHQQEYQHERTSMSTLAWDAEVESPATLAILGAGAAGIETAIYARFLGYDVMLFDTGRPARLTKRWHHRSMNATVSQLTTSLGWAALKAQDPSIIAPSNDTVWNGEQYESHYLTPLAKTDLLHDHVQFNSRVESVGRLTFHRDETHDLQARCNDEFYLIIDSRNRGVYTARADVVVDCRGLTGKKIGLGPGGGYSIGQRNVEMKAFFDTFPLDDRFEARHLENKSMLIVGLNNATQRFIREAQDINWSATANFIWLVRPDDLESASALLKVCHEKKTVCNVTIFRGYGVVEIKPQEDRSMAKLLLADDSTNDLTVDHIFVPDDPVFDSSIFRDQLHVKLSNQHPYLPELIEGTSIATTEPHYYVMPPSFNADSDQGNQPLYECIRKLFALLGDRADLDLYSIIQAQSQT